MGVEYRLLKMHRPESYDLGKARLPRGSGSSPLRGMLGLFAGASPSSHGSGRHHPGSVWTITQDGGDCVPVRLDERWPEPALLAELVLTTLEAATDADGADAISKDLLRWAGSDEVIMVADNLDGTAIARREGTTVSNWMETGSAYTPGTNAGPDGGEPL